MSTERRLDRTLELLRDARTIAVVGVAIWFVAEPARLRPRLRQGTRPPHRASHCLFRIPGRGAHRVVA